MTSPFAKPPFQVTVAPCDRVMDANALVFVNDKGDCTFIAILKPPTSFPPEPVNVYVPGLPVTEFDGNCARYEPPPVPKSSAPEGAVNWIEPASKGDWNGNPVPGGKTLQLPSEA